MPDERSPAPKDYPLGDGLGETNVGPFDVRGRVSSSHGRITEETTETGRHACRRAVKKGRGIVLCSGQAGKLTPMDEPTLGVSVGIG